MIVDINGATQEFLNYTKNYDTKEFQIKRKVSHSLRVMELSHKIAKSLNLTEEQIEIATLIGLLHDIARFEQFTKYGTYSDIKSIDHGDFGVEILKKDNFIRKFIKTNKYDETIYLAIKNHNKLKIQEGLTQEQLLQCKIIRDADKLDIFYQLACIYWQKEEVQDDRLKEEDKKAFIEQRLVDRKEYLNRNKAIEHLLTTLAFVFDLNYKISYEILKKEDYLNKYISRYEFKDKESKHIVKEIANILNEYVNNSID